MSNYVINRNSPTRLTGHDFQWVGGKLVDTNNMRDPYIVNSLLSRQAQTGPTLGLAASDYVKSAGGNSHSPYLQFTQDSTVKGIDGTSETPSYAFLANKGADTAEQSWGDEIASWFTPNEKGASVGGNIMDAVGTGVGALSGLAGMYYTKKNYDLQKEQANYEKGREAASDARKARFAANAGNGASY